jgi:hypothetical protein
MYPGNVIPGAVTENAQIVTLSVGTLEDGIGVCYGECQYDWHWNYRQTLYLTDGNQSAITVAPYPDTGSIDFMTCSVTDDSVHIWTNLYLNGCVPTTTKRSSWGSIKSLFSK